MEWSVVAVVLVLVIRFLVIQLQHLDTSALRFPVFLLLTSVLAASGAGLLAALVFTGYYRALGAQIGPRGAVILATLPRLGRYIPGKIHSTLGLAWIAHRLHGIPVRISVAVAALVAVQGVTASLVCGAMLAPWSNLPGLWTLLLAGGGLAGLIGLHPRVSLDMISWLFKRLGRDPPEERVPYTRMLALTAIACVQTLIVCGMFAWMSTAILNLDASLGGYLALAWVLATFSGFIAFFAPAGIGVQEGALLLLLSPILPPEQAAVLTVAARIWQTVVVLLTAGVGALLLVPGKSK
jgi:hypothetical protein